MEITGGKKGVWKGKAVRSSVLFMRMTAQWLLLGHSEMTSLKVWSRNTPKSLKL